MHAEADALRKCTKAGDTIIVVRILRNGSFACSKPCEKCMSFIRDMGIKKIVYIDEHNQPSIEKVA